MSEAGAGVARPRTQARQGSLAELRGTRGTGWTSGPAPADCCPPGPQDNELLLLQAAQCVVQEGVQRNAQGRGSHAQLLTLSPPPSHGSWSSTRPRARGSHGTIAPLKQKRGHAWIAGEPNRNGVMLVLSADRLVCQVVLTLTYQTQSPLTRFQNSASARRQTSLRCSLVRGTSRCPAAGGNAAGPRAACSPKPSSK